MYGQKESGLWEQNSITSRATPNENVENIGDSLGLTTPLIVSSTPTIEDNTKLKGFSSFSIDQSMTETLTSPGEMDASDSDRQPANTALRQQRMDAWQPILHPTFVAYTLLLFGVFFTSAGFYILHLSKAVVELTSEYSTDTNCAITNPNENRTCQVTFTADDDMKRPILVHYQLTNFYQNHRTYFKSRDNLQLAGASSVKSCKELGKLGGITLNPCGLIANTFFNDIIKLVSGNDSENTILTMKEEGIAWGSDLAYKFKQSNGFKSHECEDCDDCSCDGEWSCDEPYFDEKTGKCWKYFYPSEDTTQYLYETYPMKINPLEGVTNEHFVVWMQAAASSQFRKLYGKNQVFICIVSALA